MQPNSSKSITQPVILYELVKGWLTGSDPDVGETHELRKPLRPES
jgi:hypothetical protein